MTAIATRVAGKELRYSRVELKAPGVGFEPPAVPVLGWMNTGCSLFLAAKSLDKQAHIVS